MSKGKGLLIVIPDKDGFESSFQIKIIETPFHMKIIEGCDLQIN